MCSFEYNDYCLKEDSRIIFEAGKMVEFRDVERTKTWKALQHVDSRAKFSKYKISCDYDIVKNEFKDQLNLKVIRSFSCKGD